MEQNKNVNQQGNNVPPVNPVKPVEQNVQQTTTQTVTESPKVQEPAKVQHTIDVNPIMQEKGNGAVTHKVSIKCSIRRKPTSGGLPGYDDLDRKFKIGSTLNAQSKKPLKGIDGQLETIIMPKIIGIGANENNFQREVEDYWANIGVIIPSDEEEPKEENKGRLFNLQFNVRGTLLKEAINSELDIEKKFRLISKGIEDGTIDFVSEDNYFDFIFLSFAIKNKEVANDASLMWNSPKIKYYIYNKDIATTKKYNIIELKEQARPLFSEIKNDDNKLNALLMMFNLYPDAYNTTMDKVIALDEIYDRSAESLQNFIKFAKDQDLDVKYLIKLAVKKNKLTNLAGTESYYYNQILIGKNLNEAVIYLKGTEPENINIRRTLELEVKE